MIKRIIKALKEKSESMISNRMLYLRTVYAFGSQCDKIFGYMVLKEDGSIYGYSHPNEARWEFKDGKMIFYGISGNPTSIYTYFPNINIFIGNVIDKKYPLFLLPVISLNHSPPPLSVCPPVLINSIPKSGTYFMELALSNLGYKSLRLHLSGHNIVDDYRDLSEKDIHRDPEKQRLLLPIHLVTSIMKNGELVVGHIEYTNIINEIHKQGLVIFNLIRNLRNVLVSLYRFKLSKVSPISNIDEFWRTLKDENKRFIGFLIFYSDKDIQHIKECAKCMIQTKDIGITVSFEEMTKGLLNEETFDKIKDRFGINFANNLIKAIKNSFGKSTSTYSGSLSQWEAFWDDEVEEFFIKTELYDLNKALGYEEY